MNRLAGFLFIIFGLPLVANAQTTSIFDVVAATGSLTVVGTTTLQGGAFSVGGSTLVAYQGNIGIGTTTPTALMHAVGSAISGSRTEFKWIGSSGSIRAGAVTGPAWDPARIGIYTIALGLNPEAKAPYSTIAGGQSNVSAATWTFIGGGFDNQISSSVNTGGSYTSIVGGASNRSDVSVLAGFIGGGAANLLQDNYAIVVGGSTNEALGFYSFIGGGSGNSADGSFATIVNGSNNELTSCSYCSIGGGGGNRSTGGTGGVIGGGGISSAMLTVGNYVAGVSASVLGGNDNGATGDFSAALGGHSNIAAGAYSVAAGLKANAATKGSFVWADSQNQTVTAGGVDEFRARAGGGFVFLSSPTSPTTIVSSGPILISTSSTVSGAMPSLYISSANGAIGIGTSSPVTRLDVEGAAQFGTALGKSTFTSSPGGAVYSLQLSSGITISSGGPVNLTSGGFIRFGDGTISTTAASGGSGASSIVSTRTYLTTSVGDTSTSWVPVISATVTMTGGRALLAFNCPIANVSTGEGCMYGFYANNAVVTGETSTKGFGLSVAQDNGGSRASSAGGGQWQHLTESTFSGSTVFHAIFRTNDAGTCYVNDGESVSMPDRSAICQFSVLEVK